MEKCSVELQIRLTILCGFITMNCNFLCIDFNYIYVFTKQGQSAIKLLFRYSQKIISIRGLWVEAISDAQTAKVKDQSQLCYNKTF